MLGSGLLTSPEIRFADSGWPQKQLRQIRAVSHQTFETKVTAMNQEIDVSGAYVLGTIGLAFLVMVPLVWAFVRYWLFAP
jgi:hypothetical protein